MFFDQKKLTFFDGIFFEVHLPIQANRFEAISNRFQQSKGEKTVVEKTVGRAIFALAACVMGYEAEGMIISEWNIRNMNFAYQKKLFFSELNL